MQKKTGPCNDALPRYVGMWLIKPFLRGAL